MALQINRKNTIIRRACLAAAVIVFAVLQNTPGWFPRIAGVRALILIPLVTAIAMTEREKSGILYGLLAGALWDTVARGNSFNAIFLVIAGFVCGTLINTVMRNNFVTHLLLTGAALVIYNLGYWLWHYVFVGLAGSFSALITYYLPCAVYTAVFAPPIYFAVYWLGRNFNE